jgi:hypothetical protein
MVVSTSNKNNIREIIKAIERLRIQWRIMINREKSELFSRNREKDEIIERIRIMD